MIIGITGGLGTGKTTVAKMFASKGAKLLDADKLSHMALKKGSLTHKKVISYFGREILNKDKSINKRRLARIVFNNRNKLKSLTNIIHPFVIKKIKAAIIKKIDSKEIIIIDAPLLIEAGLTHMVDKLLVVKVDRKTQLRRLIKKRKFKTEEVVDRIKNQIPLDKKIRIADYIIDNRGALEKTKKQVSEIWRDLRWT